VTGYVCPECGLDYDTVSPSDAIAAVRSFPRRYREALFGLTESTDEHPDAVVRRRPDPSTWSALEYTAHVRDALEWMADAIRRMNREREPTIDSFDQDQRAIDERYNEQDVNQMLDGLTAAADRLAAVLRDVDAGDWGRIGHFSWGDRDMLAMTRNAVHEGAHHLRDVDKVLRAVVGRPPSA
jgi:DNA segregation ATPase FtsK/SpoIIIE, S-DNA-T family